MARFFLLPDVNLPLLTLYLPWQSRNGCYQGEWLLYTVLVLPCSVWGATGNGCGEGARNGTIGDAVMNAAMRCNTPR